MKVKISLISALILVLGICSGAAGKSRKKQPQRGMLESMEAVPCGAKERGITGLGSVFASAGITHVNSDEKLCPQYLLRTDEMDYHIRPVDNKHGVILPVGHEGEFKIKKDRLFLKVPDGDRKTRAYRVVAMKPLNSEVRPESSAHHAPDKPVQYRPLNKSADKVPGTNPGPSR